MEMRCQCHSPASLNPSEVLEIPTEEGVKWAPITGLDSLEKKTPLPLPRIPKRVVLSLPAH